MVLVSPLPWMLFSDSMLEFDFVPRLLAPVFLFVAVDLLFAPPRPADLDVLLLPDEPDLALLPLLELLLLEAAPDLRVPDLAVVDLDLRAAAPFFPAADFLAEVPDLLVPDLPVLDEPALLRFELRTAAPFFPAALFFALLLTDFFVAPAFFVALADLVLAADFLVVPLFFAVAPFLPAADFLADVLDDFFVVALPLLPDVLVEAATPERLLFLPPLALELDFRVPFDALDFLVDRFGLDFSSSESVSPTNSEMLFSAFCKPDSSPFLVDSFIDIPSVGNPSF